MNIWCFLHIFGRQIDFRFYTSLWKWDLCSCILLVKLVFWTDGLTMAMLISRHLIQNGIFIFTFFVTNRNIASGLRESELILSWPDIFCASFSDSSPLSVTSHCPTFGNTDISNLKDIFEKRLNHLYLISFHIEFYLLRIFLKNQLGSLTLSTSLVAKTAKYCRSSNRHLEEKLRQKTFCGQTCECTPDTIGRRGPEGGK